jgi:pSer/pThr/pTyr-binding forkhead associated (FHA) protein
VAGQTRTGEAYSPTIVNGQPVTADQWLADGDTLQIGRRTLQFHEKATRNNPIQPAAPAAPAAGASPYVGQELADTTVVALRPSLTTPLQIVEQMGTAPEAAAPLLSLAQPVSDATVMMTSPVYEDAHLGIGTRLVCTEGPYAGQSFALSHAPQTLGRGTDRDLPFPADTSVSRAHARIAYENGRHFVADDGSSNGTFVNGLRLDVPRALRPGDLLQLGGTTLRYE